MPKPTETKTDHCPECGAATDFFERGLSCGWECRQCDWEVVTTNSDHPAFDPLRYDLCIEFDPAERKQTIAAVAAQLGLELAAVRERIDAGEPVSRQLSRYDLEQLLKRLLDNGISYRTDPERRDVQEGENK